MIIRGISLLTIILIVCLQISCLRVSLAQSATYYISPTGSDANPGTSAKPWLTFAYAIDPARATCGDTLLLTNGTYGDDTSTGKIFISRLICTVGNELTIRALNQRQAKIVDNGTGRPVNIENSAYIVVDGLYARSTDNIGGKVGTPFRVNLSHHVTFRNNVARNPNRYANTPVYSALNSQDILYEDNEAYVFHRHCVTGWQSERIVVRRQYCNPRGGKIPGGFSAGGMPLSSGDSVFSMYPCKNCILENSIADGTTHPMYLNEMNATFGSGVLMSGSTVLGSICYKCNAGNGIYPNSRKVADATNHTPLNITIRDVAIVDYGAPANGIRCSDCVNVTIDHVTVLGTNTGSNGISADQTSTGATASQSSITITNTVVQDMAGSGYSICSGCPYSGNHLYSYNNGRAFSPGTPGNWGSTHTGSPGFGACKMWIPAGSPLKGAGTGGSDIGATILYRYVNGVLTSTPLWDPTTGEFPHGAPDLDGTNRAAGQSLFDIHIRLNVNTGGCSFPRNYGNGDSKPPASPVGLKAS